VLYVIPLAWPEGGKLTVQSLSDSQPALGGIRAIRLLGSDAEIHWRRDADGLTIEVPAEVSGHYAHVFEITPEP